MDASVPGDAIAGLQSPRMASGEQTTFTQSDGTTRRVGPGSPRSSRLGIVTPEMQRVAEREPHLTPEQVRDEVAAGRMIIPANKVHLGHRLDPMAIGRASRPR
jgi:phosphomethylpyrimidine synthase